MSRGPVKTCFGCVFYESREDRFGISSWCGLTDDPLAIETVAEDCESYESR